MKTGNDITQYEYDTPEEDKPETATWQEADGDVKELEMTGSKQKYPIEEIKLIYANMNRQDKEKIIEYFNGQDTGSKQKTNLQ